MLQRLRSLARRGLNRVEAALHPGRRRRALARLQARSTDPVIFICYGNICRSPFAEWWMRARGGDGGALYTSAGFMPGGRSSPDTAIAVARDEFGLDLTDHVSRDIDEASRIATGSPVWVVMEYVHQARLARLGIDRDDILILGDLEPGPVERRAIIDPYGRTPEVFAATYRRIVRCLEVLDGVHGR